MSQTLQEIKKERGLFNKDVAKALGCSASKAGMILQGRAINVYYDEDIQQLANILGCTFERCWYAMCESHKQWRIATGQAPREHYDRASVIRQDAQRLLQARMPDIVIPQDPVRELATVGGYIAIGGPTLEAQTA